MIPRFRFSLVLPSGRRLELGARTLVMGILNVTPDSFADGGKHVDPGAAEAAGVEMAARGADLIDVGGESTRPGSTPISAEDEIARIQPVIRRLRRAVTIPISIDTSKAAVAAVALAEGAELINDVTALRYDSRLAEISARSGAALVLMHSRGRPKDMYGEAHYESVVRELTDELRTSLERAVAAGVPRESVILDPGLGFAKKAEHSFEVLAGLSTLAALGRPLLVGPSRKSFLTAATGDRKPQDRDMATAASVTAAVLSGAHIVRVHNVPDMVEVVRVADAIRGAADRSKERC